MTEIYKIFGRKKGRNKKLINSKIDDKFLLNIKKKILEKKIILDIGSGYGENAICLAQKYPDKLIIAVEIYQDGILNLIKNIQQNNIKNIKIYNNNVLYLLEKNNFENLLDEIWILFPDPWPKVRHNKRRLINNSFLKKMNDLIHIRGKVFIATDSTEYFISILYDIYKTKIFYWINDKGKKWQYSYLKIPETKYFKKSLKNGRKSMFIELSKI